MPDLITLQEAVDEFRVGIATPQKDQLRRDKQGGHESELTNTFVGQAALRGLLKARPVARAKRVPPRRSGYVRTAGWQAQRERGVIRLQRRKDETDQDWIARRDAELAAAQDRARSRRSGVKKLRLGAGRTRGRG